MTNTHTAALDAFITAKTEIDMMLARVRYSPWDSLAGPADQPLLQLWKSV